MKNEEIIDFEFHLNGELICWLNNKNDIILFNLTIYEK